MLKTRANKLMQTVSRCCSDNNTKLLGIVAVLVVMLSPTILEAYASTTYQVEARGESETTNRPWYGARAHIGLVLPENVNNALDDAFFSGAPVSNSGGSPVEFTNAGYIVCKTGVNQDPCIGGRDDNTKAEWFFEFFHNSGTIDQLFGAPGSAGCSGCAFTFQQQTASAGSTTWQYFEGSVMLGSSAASLSDRILDGDAPSGVGEVVQATDTSSQMGPVIFFPTVEYMNNARSWQTLSHADAIYSPPGICPPWGFTVLAFQKTEIGSGQGCPTGGSRLW